MAENGRNGVSSMQFIKISVPILAGIVGYLWVTVAGKADSKDAPPEWFKDQVTELSEQLDSIDTRLVEMQLHDKEFDLRVELLEGKLDVIDARLVEIQVHGRETDIKVKNLEDRVLSTSNR
jgi:hypothetical protein